MCLGTEQFPMNLEVIIQLTFVKNKFKKKKTTLKDIKNSKSVCLFLVETDETMRNREVLEFNS